MPISHETQRLRVTRECYPLLEGWHSVIDADPQTLLNRGYDKVICVQKKSFIEHGKASAEYHRQCFTIEDYINLALNDSRFFLKAKQKYDRLNKQIEDHRYFRFTLSDWNNFTLQTFFDLLDFLEFPSEDRIYIIPVKMPDRDFEGYSDSHISKDCKLEKPVEVIRNRV